MMVPVGVVPVTSMEPGGKAEKQLSHHPLVLFSNLPNDHGHFDEVQLEFKSKFRKTKMTMSHKSPCVSAYMNFNV